MHNGAHLTLAPAVISALRDVGLETPSSSAGSSRHVDLERLAADGVAAVLGPGASSEEVVSAVRDVAAARRSA